MPYIILYNSSEAALEFTNRGDIGRAWGCVGVACSGLAYYQKYRMTRKQKYFIMHSLAMLLVASIILKDCSNAYQL